MQTTDQFIHGLRAAASGAALLFALAAPAQAGIIYEFELVSGGSPTGFIVGSVELPSLFGSAALPEAFAYTIFGNAFGLGQVAGASWEIDGTTGEFLNLVLIAQRQNIFPGSVPLITATLTLGLSGAMNVFTDAAIQTIFQTDSLNHRLVLTDDGGLLDLPAPPDPEPAPVPEPAALALFGLGLAGLTIGRRSRRPSARLLL